MAIVGERNIINAEFKMDKDFNIISGNREFLRFLNIVDATGSFLDYLDDYDINKLTDFVKDFKPSNNTKSIIVTLDVDAEFVPALLTYKSSDDKSYAFSIENVDFAGDFMSDALVTRSTYEILLSAFDCEFMEFNYMTEELILKNTKNLQPIYGTTIEGLAHFLENRYDVNTDSDFTHEAMEKLEADLIAKNGGKRYSLLLKNRRYIILTGHFIKAENGADKYIITINNENSLKESSPSYKETHDALTGLLNRETIQETAKRRIDTLKSETSIMILDVDRFKEYNDSLGHQYGDLVLSKVGKAIKNAVVQYGEAGRIGGDEFLVVINSADEEIVRNVCRNIRLGVQWCMEVDNPDFVITCSMGVARFPLNGDDFDKLFGIADKCLYIAKGKGRNCYVIYRPNIHDKIFVNQSILNDAFITGKYYSDKAIAEKKILDAVEAEEFNVALDRLLNYLEITQITVFDKHLLARYKVGGTQNFRIEAIRDEDYFRYYNEYGFFLLDNVSVLDSLNKEVHSLYKNANIASVLEVKVTDASGNLMGVITYDVVKPAKTFDKAKVSFVLMVSKMILEKM